MIGTWNVIFHDEFVAEYRELSQLVQDGLVALIVNLGERGPLLGRPYVDTLNGSRHAKMKELRFNADGGIWRAAFAFDPERRAILLAAGNKAGVGKDRFYRDLIRLADRRFDEHLKTFRAK